MAIGTTPTEVIAPVKSSWFSKINWAQIIGVLASVLVIFGIEIPPETTIAIVAGIQAFVSAITMIFRTWFTKSVTAASSTALPPA